MSKLTKAQLELLQSAAATVEHTIDRPKIDGRIISGVIKRGLMLAQISMGGVQRLNLTAEGLSALATPTEDAAPPPADPNTEAKPPSKLARVVALLRQPGGTTMDALMAETGWQQHSVRGALAGSIKKGMGLNVVSEKRVGVRIYSIPAGAK